MKKSLNTNNTKFIAEKYLRNFGYIAMNRVGVPKHIYKIVIDGLIETSLRGVDSHGVRLIPHYVKAVLSGRINKKPHFFFEKTAPSTGIFDANNGFGIAAGVEAMDKAIMIARETGIGAVSTINSSHFGAAAIFGLRAGRNDMIGIVFTDVDSLVNPYGGKKTYFGTNPICFTAPISGEDPFCLDMATSRVSLNKIIAYREAEKPLESGWAVDFEGKPTNDPKLATSLLPIGEYKGYGLSAMISILSSLLTGMPFGPHINPMYPLNDKQRKLGHFFLALDISKFQPVDVFKKRMKEMVDELRNIPPIDKNQPVIVAGDPEKINYGLRSKKGIPLLLHDIATFNSLANELQMEVNCL